MLKFHFTGHSNWTNVYLTREGEKIGTELPHVSMCYDYPYYSLEIEADSMMMVVGDFCCFYRMERICQSVPPKGPCTCLL